VFKNAYSTHPRCIPSRVSLLTGKYPVRFDVPNDKTFEDPNKYYTFGPEEVTTGEAFERHGYSTVHIGKWHLTHPKAKENEKTWPWNQGFQSCHGVSPANPGTHWSPYGKKKWKMKKIAPGPKGTYLTDQLTDIAVGEITKNRNTPFFLQLAHYAVHTPIDAKPEIIETYDKVRFPKEFYIEEKKISQVCRVNQNNQRYAAMVTSVDQSVGRIVATLQRLGLHKNTVVILTSDNGGDASKEYNKEWNDKMTRRQAQILPTSNLPLRLGKRYLYEGGIRVPLIVHVPGADTAVSTAPVTGADLYPTMLDAAGLPTDPAQHKDGRSFKCALEGKGTTPQCRALWWRPLFWYDGKGISKYGRHSAIRRGKFKLIKNLDSGRTELYDLHKDVGERKNLFQKKYQPITRYLVRTLNQKIKSIQGAR